MGAAIRYGDERYCIEILSEGVPLSLSSSICGNCEPLIEALNWRQPHIALTLVDRGANLNGVTCHEHSCQKYTAIHYCARYNFGMVLRKLIDLCPSLLFVASEIHPLYIAIANKSNECLRIMLEQSAEAWQRSMGSSLTSWTTFAMSKANATSLEARALPVRSRGFSLISSADLTRVATPSRLVNDWQLSENLRTPGISPSWLTSPLHFAAGLANY